MLIDVMYFSYQPYFLELAKEMQKDNWNPVYWNVIENIKEDIKESFPNVICHNHYDAIKGIPPLEYKDKILDSLCPTFLIKMSKYERIALRMMERNDTFANNFSYRERVELYKYFVQYWLTVLNDLKPKYIIFEEEPHQATEYVLYAICQLKNIECIMFVRTTINQYLYPVNSFENGSDIISDKYKYALEHINLDTLVLSDFMNEYLNNILGSYEEAITLHLYDQIDEVNILVSENSLLVNYIKDFKKIISKININTIKIYCNLLFSKSGKYFLSDQKQKGKTLKNSKLTYIEHLYYKTISIFKKKRLKKYYDLIISQNIDLNVPYVFCAIHYQPEKTTCPLGGDFDDQLYMIQLLSENLPAGWLLYVKEHPSQFISSYARYGEHYRTKEYYDNIIRLSNVRLLSISSDTFKLIDNAKAVATVTSTSAWEAVIRKTPSLVFGYSWFNHCNGVFHVSSLEDIKSFFISLQNGLSIDLNEIKLFLKIIEENTFKGIIGGPGVQKYFSISVKKNSNEHAKAIRALIKYNSEKLNYNE